MISPNLRTLMLGQLVTAIGGLDKYSPWSYIGCAVAGLVFATVVLIRGSRCV